MSNDRTKQERQRCAGRGLGPAPRACVILSFLMGLAVAGSAKADTIPRDTKPLASSEVYALYLNRTWLWHDGAGWFDRSGEFRAWSGEGPASTYADGRWWVNHEGAMCFKAVWHSAKGSGSSETCFSHRKNGKTLYQKKEPAGSWYVFRNSPVKAGDEFNKLETGNLTEDKWKATKAAVSP